jgi:anti-anti-sigma factor
MSQPGDRFESDLLRIEATHGAGTVTLKVAGELDITTRGSLWSHVDAAIASRPDSITLEASDLVFVDSTGFAALLRARTRAKDARVAFRVTEPSPALCRLADVGGIGDDFLSDW